MLEKLTTDEIEQAFLEGFTFLEMNDEAVTKIFMNEYDFDILKRLRFSNLFSVSRQNKFSRAKLHLIKKDTIIFASDTSQYTPSIFRPRLNKYQIINA